MSHTATKIGILVPSSNTALEPLTTSILSSLPNLTIHFSRFPVTTISLTPTSLTQFSTTDPNTSPIIAAAKLLADAHVDVIGWSGTSGGWLGFEVDEGLCAAIERETGVKATTSTLALNRALRLLKMQRFGLVTPYVDDVQARIVQVYENAGWGVVESHLGVSENVKIVEVGELVLGRQMKEVLEGLEEEGTKVVSTFCTNLRAAQLVEGWEREFERSVVLDTVATVIWDCLKIVGRDPSEVKGWGKLFDL